MLGSVKKCGVFKILHEKIRKEKKFQSESNAFRETFAEAVIHNKDLEQYLNKAQVGPHFCDHISKYYHSFIGNTHSAKSIEFIS